AEVEISAGTVRISASAGAVQRATKNSGEVRSFRPSGEVATPFGLLSFHARPPAAAGGIMHALDARQLTSSTLHVRRPKAGDKCVPSGRHHAVPLARFLAKAGVPQSLRGTTPLLCVENRIVAALGVRVMEPFSPKPGSKALYLHWRPAEMPIITYTDRSGPRPR
ncbi:MAG TPA: tRNA lysidine(34) synthetase TilS, partial [Candidatus Eremiobacteraceae bacterium]|nr:tRNA lysidine(34) synthetase TilS [Candidatus Eremiobacteraceae bacterium]